MKRKDVSKRQHIHLVRHKPNFKVITRYVHTIRQVGIIMSVYFSSCFNNFPSMHKSNADNQLQNHFITSKTDKRASEYRHKLQRKTPFGRNEVNICKIEFQLHSHTIENHPHTR